MNRKLKALGLALVVVMATSAVAASGAQAVKFKSSGSEAGTTYITGAQTSTNVITTTAGTVKCTVVKFKSSFAGATAGALTVTPEYQSCIGFGQTATFTTNGCTYALAEPSSTTTGDIGLSCPAGQVIAIDVPTGNCTLTIGAQTFKGDLDYTNLGITPNKDVQITGTMKEIEFTVDGPGSICGTVGTHNEASEASYTGTVTMKGYSNSSHTNQVDLFLD
jgi:hypothetical protein